MTDTPKKTWIELKEEELVAEKNKVAGYETELDTLYGTIEKIIKKKEESEKKIKELEEKLKNKDNEEQKISLLLTQNQAVSTRVGEKIKALQKLADEALIETPPK